MVAGPVQLQSTTCLANQKAKTSLHPGAKAKTGLQQKAKTSFNQKAKTGLHQKAKTSFKKPSEEKAKPVKRCQGSCLRDKTTDSFDSDFFSVFENVLFLCRNSHFRKLKNKSSESKVAGGFFLNVAALRREDGVLRVDGGFKLVFRGALAGDSNGMIYYLCENKKQTYSMCTKHSAHLFFLEPKGGR